MCTHWSGVGHVSQKTFFFTWALRMSQDMRKQYYFNILYLFCWIQQIYIVLISYIESISHHRICDVSNVILNVGKVKCLQVFAFIRKAAVPLVEALPNMDTGHSLAHICESYVFLSCYWEHNGSFGVGHIILRFKGPEIFFNLLEIA